MPVIIQSKTRYIGTVSPSSLNTETTVVEITAQSDDYIAEGWIDLGALASGDVVVINEYVAVDGTNYRLYAKETYIGPLSKPIVRLHAKTFTYNMKYKVMINQTTGTLRSYHYCFIVELMGMV